MGVADDVVLGIQLLWCCKVIRVRVGEMARIDVPRRHFDLERGVRLDRVEIFRCDEL